ncbi:hypothetical protein TNCV_4328821 [Trichonephila clavipes]|nr:hypothetical protein TNCV_4328821 [Trichonephila clavipes]
MVYENTTCSFEDSKSSQQRLKTTDLWEGFRPPTLPHFCDNFYPEDEWLLVYMDGSKLTDNRYTYAGVCCKLLSFYTPIEIHSTAFDAVFAALRIALFQLHSHTDRVS